MKYNIVKPAPERILMSVEIQKIHVLKRNIKTNILKFEYFKIRL